MGFVHGGAGAIQISPIPSSPAKFIQRFEAAFGRRQALLLKLAGFHSGEVSASGCTVVDSSGRRWLDFGSFGVHLLGHRHPQVLQPVRDQLDRMGLSTKILASEALLVCGQEIIDLCGPGFTSLVFTNSGSEAVEAAIRLANVSTGRNVFAALEQGYHGKTLGSAALTDSRFRPAIAERALQVMRLPREDSERAVSILREHRPAALFVELIQGEGGIWPLADDYLRTVRDACRGLGTLFVIDEIQTGLGRTGRRLESERLGLRPDIVIIGKVLSGGLIPIAATVFDKTTIGEKAADPVLHSSTFAGGPLAAAAASAVVRLVSTEPFLDRVNQLGAIAMAALQTTKLAVAGISEVRGRGLMLGVEFDTAALCGRAVIEAAKRNLLVSFCLNEPRVMRIYPPVVVTDAQLGQALALLRDAAAAANEM